MSLFIPVWGLVTISGLVGWGFGYKIIIALAVVGGLMYGGILNF